MTPTVTHARAVVFILFLILHDPTSILREKWVSSKNGAIDGIKNDLVHCTVYTVQREKMFQRSLTRDCTYIQKALLL